MQQSPMYSAVPGYDAQSYRVVPKRFWREQHWRAYVRDAEEMLKFCHQHPARFSAEEWTGVLAQRRNEMALAGYAVDEPCTAF